MVQARINTAIPAEFIHRRARGSGHIRNLGAEGLFIGTYDIPEEGESIQVRFMSPDGDMARVSGLVWWTSEGSGRNRSAVPGFGIRTVEANGTFNAMLARLLA